MLWVRFVKKLFFNALILSVRIALYCTFMPPADCKEMVIITILLPSATVFLVLLLMLSLILAVTTLFPDLDAIKLASVLGSILVASLVVMGVVALVQRMRKGPDPEQVALSRMEKETWQMPPLAELTRPTWSVTRKIGMFTLRAYLLIAVILLWSRLPSSPPDTERHHLRFTQTSLLHGRSHLL